MRPDLYNVARTPTQGLRPKNTKVGNSNFLMLICAVHECKEFQFDDIPDKAPFTDPLHCTLAYILFSLTGETALIKRLKDSDTLKEEFRNKSTTI